MFCTFECFFIALASLLWTCSFCAFFFTNFIFRNVRPSTSGSWILGRPINQLWNCDSFEIDLLIILGMLASVQVIAGNKSSFLSPLKERSNLFFSLKVHPWNVFSLLTIDGSWGCSLFLASLAKRCLSLVNLNTSSRTFLSSNLWSMLVWILSFSISCSACLRVLVRSWNIVKALS